MFSRNRGDGIPTFFKVIVVGGILVQSAVIIALFYAGYKTLQHFGIL